MYEKVDRRDIKRKKERKRRRTHVLFSPFNTHKQEHVHTHTRMHASPLKSTFKSAQ